ncbi:FAST kinase domain-containing protein 3, mitochondrial [Manduca sexta]|uniref:RAP domain-containing protein n=1 Tax=Manduca sexta TaxID=7130 RepID=A0A921ZIL0_MANSE|nr:FAST kinase domain-containing protein 3, mitochondrial [Manduca sexta]KAG6458156.1 hypothetical protein O3G_MSEX010727 [Manduca sexta]
MALALRRTYMKAKNNLLCSTCVNTSPIVLPQLRSYSDDKFSNNPQFSSTTIMMEHGYNVQELPVVVRKLKDFSEIVEKPPVEPAKSPSDSHNYHLIQEEFQQCSDLRDVFTLLSKCTKITPNIALGAIERIYDLEKQSIDLDSKSIHINLAKGAILDKLLKVVVKTEDTQTILNILNTVSTFMEPYKHKFSDELLFRVLDNKLSVEQLCQFLKFLINNKSDPKYCETIDKLWVGFVERHADVNETNISHIFAILHGLKLSKKTVLNLLEQKLYDLWYKINVTSMQEILDTFVREKYLSMQSFVVVGRWLHTNIHVLDDDSLLDIITKLTRLNYTDDQIEKAVDKYMKLKCTKIKNYILIVGILNYCMQFQIRNEQLLNACSEYFMKNASNIPASFLKCIIYPFGFLNYNPSNLKFWKVAEETLLEKFDKMTTDDLSSIILSFTYLEKYPLPLVRRIFTAEYLIKVNDQAVMKKLYLIDTALSLECPQYAGPLLPKDQWSKPVPQDHRITNIISKTIDHFVNVAGSIDKLSTSILIPHFCSDETYFVDIMIHSKSLGSNNFDWKSKSGRNDNIAILINLPDHFCSDNERLVGPQLLRKKHLKMLGLKVVNIKYSVLSQFYTSYNAAGMRQYLIDSIENAESST